MDILHFMDTLWANGSYQSTQHAFLGLKQQKKKKNPKIARSRLTQKFRDGGDMFYDFFVFSSSSSPSSSSWWDLLALLMRLPKPFPWTGRISCEWEINKHTEETHTTHTDHAFLLVHTFYVKFLCVCPLIWKRHFCRKFANCFIVSHGKGFIATFSVFYSEK